jgi:hypothetical protein
MAPPPTGGAAVTDATRAIDVPASRRSLRHRWIGVLVIGTVALSLLVAAAATAIDKAEERELQANGTRAAATVTGIDAQPVGRSRSLDGSVKLSYVTDGQTVESAAYVGAAITDYHPGDVVEVMYERATPSHVEVVDARSSGRDLPALAFLVAGLLATAAALAAARLAHHIGRHLRAHDWHPVPTRLVQVPQSLGLRQGSKTFVVVELLEGPITVETVGLSRVDPAFAPEAWLAGRGAPTMLLAPPGGAHVVPVRVHRRTP